MIVTSKTGLDGKETKYRFEHIPRIGKTTIRIAREERGEGTSVEQRNLRTAVIGTIIMSIITWICWIVFKGLVFRILRIQR